MAKTGTTSTDFIPDKDDDFYNFSQQIIEVLKEPNEPDEPSPSPAAAPAELNWQAWHVPETKFDELHDLWMIYEPLYKKSQSKKDRTAKNVDDHRQARKELEAYLRKFINQYLRYEDQVPRGEKIRMGILPSDTEPSPVHGSHLITGSPVISLKNMGGSAIDLRFKRTTDQTRASMPKGYMAEISYQIGGTPPTDPDAVGMKTKISSKARFQITTAMPNLGKTFFVFGKWKHKTNSANDSPWTNLMQITIA